MGLVCHFGQAPVILSLLGIAPGSDQAIRTEIDDSYFRPVAKIERDKCLTHVQTVNPGLALVRRVDAVGLAVQLDNLFSGHADFGISLRLLLNRLRF